MKYLDKNTLETIRRVFLSKTLSIEDDGEYESEYIKIKTSNGLHCASFAFNFENTIYIHFLEKCGDTTGTELLNMFDTLAKRMPKITHIGLQDDSKITICGEIIKLFILKILTTGQSWYNSHGYFSNNHESEKSYNEGILNMNSEQFINMMYEDENKRFMRENSMEGYKEKIKHIDKIKNKILFSKYEDILRNYYTRIYPIIDEHKEEQKTDNINRIRLFPDVNKTVTEYFQYVWSDIIMNMSKTGCANKKNIEKCKWLSKFIINVHKSQILKFTPNVKKMVVSKEEEETKKSNSKKSNSKKSNSKKSNSKKSNSKKSNSKKSNSKKSIDEIKLVLVPPTENVPIPVIEKQPMSSIPKKKRTIKQRQKLVPVIEQRQKLLLVRATEAMEDFPTIVIEKQPTPIKKRQDSSDDNKVVPEKIYNPFTHRLVKNTPSNRKKIQQLGGKSKNKTRKNR